MTQFGTAALLTALLVIRAIGLVSPPVGETQVTRTGAAVLVPLSGEERLQAPQPNTFGTESSVAYTIPAFLFQASDGSAISSTPYNRFHPSEVEASVQLPAGAVVTSIELEGCDTNAADEIVFI